MPDVCIIGAGSSGITAVKTLVEAGIAVDCFELASNLGGNWRYDNDNDRSAAYRSLHIDTSKERMAFSDFPMPADYPNFPHHSQIAAYFDAYADHFDLRRHISFRTRVDRVAPAAGGGYEVTTSALDGGASTTRHYAHVLVCNGHHWQPNLPHFPGTFAGQTLHSQTYRTPEFLHDKNVLVIGIGNSGSDIACEAARVARNTFLSTRRSAYIIPRYIMGRPTDKWLSPFVSSLPWALQRFGYRILLFIAQGNQAKYGVPYPKHRLLAEHPTMSADLLHLAALKMVHIKPDVAQLEGDRVRFKDGSVEPIDVIVYATGYQISFPFFAPEFFSVADNNVRLYRRVVDPARPGLYFIGLVQPLGAIMPLAEQQARWVTELITGRCALPDRHAMQREIAAYQAHLRRRYVKSNRHTIQVDFYPYLRQLRREIAAGRKRAAAPSGPAQPVVMEATLPP